MGGGDNALGFSKPAFEAAHVITHAAFGRPRELAARRRMFATRLATLRVPVLRMRPPLMRLSGQRPSQLAKASALRNFSRTSLAVPSSFMSTQSTPPLTPGTALKSSSRPPAQGGAN